MLSAVLGLTVENELVTFDSTSPQIIVGSVEVSGLQRGEKLLGIDFRPATGDLYGVGSSDRLYRIDPATGTASQVGSGRLSPRPNGESLGVDFNPVPDLLRVVSQTDQNLRIHPDTGMVIDSNPLRSGVQADGDIAYANGDLREGRDARLVGVAYTNNFAGAPSTTLYGIDANKDSLVIVGSPGGAPVSPNTGQLSTVGPLGVNTTRFVGFDIGTDGTALASLRRPDERQSELFTINLETGAATLVGTIGTNRALRDLSFLPAPPPPPIAISIDDISVAEGDAGVTLVPFAVTLSAPSSTAVTVDFTVVDVTASNGDDYALAPGPLVIPPGQTSASVVVAVNGDTASEPDETFVVNLVNPVGGILIDAQGVGTIINDDFNQVVTIETVLGPFQVELFGDVAPLTVANFLNYVLRGDYDATIIHRSIPNFIIQGGGYRFDGTPLPPFPSHIPTDPAIPDEVMRPNLRGTLAMAKTSQPDSATSEWFVNLVDNPHLNSDFTVFGQVLGAGMQLVDAISVLPTFDFGVPFDNLPLRDYSGSGPITGGNLVVFDRFTLTAGVSELASIELQTVDDAGNPIGSIQVGQSFHLQAVVRDLRAVDQGVLAAYLDVSFDPGRAVPAGPAEFGLSFPNLQTLTFGVGRIDESGALSDLSVPLGPRLLWSVPYQATSTGPLTFTPDPADLLPAHDVLLVGINYPILPSMVRYVGATIDVVP